MTAHHEAGAADDPLTDVERRRALGAAERDPVRFGVIEALARRAAVHEGEAQRLLVQRLQALLAEFDAAPVSPHPPPVHGATALAGLSALVDRLGRTAAPPGATRSSLQPPTPKPLKAMARHQGTWSRLRADQRLRQALAQVPAMAGPLNSSHLVNRALQELRGVSPAYLDAFMAHADTLLWLEQASGGNLPVSAARPARKG